MKTTIEKYFETENQRQEKCIAISQELDNLIRQQGEAELASKEAANCGDLDLYMEKEAERRRIDSEIYVKRTFLNQLQSMTFPEKAVEAWESYAKDFSKRLKSAVAEYEAEKTVLMEKYSALVTLQSEALNLRKRMVEASGASVEDFQMDYIPCVYDKSKTPGKLTLGGINSVDPDVCFYLANYYNRSNIQVKYYEPDPEAEKVFNTVVAHRSV